MADLYGLEQSGIDPEIASQMLGLKRRRDIANLMAQQGMAGIDMPSTPSGGYTPKISPLVGVAKVLQAYMANKMAGDADSEQAKLMGESQRRSAETMQGYEQMRRGTPAQPIADAGPGDAVDTSTTMNAVPGNPREAIANLLAKAPHMANNPLVKGDIASMQQMSQPRVLGRTLVDGSGKTLATDSTWAQEQQAAQEAKAAAAKAAMEARAAEGAAQRQNREDMVRLAASLRTPAAPPAPSFTEVLDPKDPTRLLRVDGKVYKGGTLGDVGVLGISGKEPTAATQANTKAEGKATVNDVVSTLRGHYDSLEKGGGIVDDTKGAVSNATARLQSSAAGQFLGGVVGTKNQTARDGIAMTRPLLLAAVKNATGLTAKQLDSNADVKLWLTAATDPTKGVQANRSALNNILKYYGLEGAEASNVDTGSVRQGGAFDADKERRYQEWKKKNGG